MYDIYFLIVIIILSLKNGNLIKQASKSKILNDIATFKILELYKHV